MFQLNFITLVKYVRDDNIIDYENSWFRATIHISVNFENVYLSYINIDAYFISGMFHNLSYTRYKIATMIKFQMLCF